ncbi:AAA family ATPase [uncultured Agrococcus sp.]|uniref:AAA family ATPase n=1 Tax=uncultured Agrococcus sp. TaxID=382258 RepID=UPI0025EE9895|nr:AAA family ATPase [uncultured Agrococcus sp.]
MKVTLIDGRSGAGKSSFARRLSADDGVRILTMDYLYEGWDGLMAGSALLERILVERAEGAVARWRDWDWHAYSRGRERTLEPHESLIVEGCGAMTPITVAFADRAIWLEAPEDVRRARALARDGDDSWWEGWKQQERIHLERHDPRSLATEIIDASS